MKKEDPYQKYSRDVANDKYWNDSKHLMDQESYTQRMRQDKLTAIDAMKREFHEIVRQHEQAKAEMGARAKEKEQEDKAAFEEWRRQREAEKEKGSDE